jgi:phosphoserine phosphatase
MPNTTATLTLLTMATQHDVLPVAMQRLQPWLPSAHPGATSAWQPCVPPGLPGLTPSDAATVAACRWPLPVPVALKPQLTEALAGLPVDVALLTSAQQAWPRVVLSDMDSTLIQAECIDELADLLGIKAQVAAITEQAMRGELDFAQALAQRVALLRGLVATEALAALWPQRLPVMPGSQALMRCLADAGTVTMLVSGGFTLFSEPVATALGVQRQLANTLVSDATGRLTGEVSPPLVDAMAKRSCLYNLCTELACDTSQAVALGDGANDLPMLCVAGLSVAVRGKPAVQVQAHVALNVAPLHALLWLWH